MHAEFLQALHGGSAGWSSHKILLVELQAFGGKSQACHGPVAHGNLVNLLINWDQTGIYGSSPSLNYTKEKRGTSCIEISSYGNLRIIIACLAAFPPTELFLV